MSFIQENFQRLFGKVHKRAIEKFIDSIDFFYMPGVEVDKEDIKKLKIIRANIDIILEHFDK